MKRPLILAAPGSESTAGRAAVARLVNAVRREAHDFDVREAFLDVEEPSVPSVIADTLGPRTVVPLVLSQEALWDSARLGPARADPHVTIAATLGPDWSLAEVGVQRLVEAGARSDDSILLVAEAVTTDDAAVEVGTAARLLSAVWGGPVHVGLLGGPDVLLADALDIARAHGHRSAGPRHGRVVVSSYLLSDGTAQEQLRRTDADLVTEPFLAPGATDPRLVSLVVSRARSRSATVSCAGS